MIDYREKLRIDKYALDQEIAMQSDRFQRVADRATEAAARRDEAKDELKAITGRRACEIRSKALTDNRKLTEAKIEALVAKDKERRQAAARLIEAEAEAGRAQNLKEAWAMRAWMLRELAGLFTAGYYADVSTQGGSARDVQEMQADANRRKIRDKRRRL